MKCTIGKTVFVVSLGLMSISSWCGGPSSTLPEPERSVPQATATCFEKLEGLQEPADELVDTVRECARYANAQLLLGAAHSSMERGDYREGVYLYIAGSTRYAIDGEVYGLNKKAALLVLLGQKLRDRWLPEVIDSPEVFEAALALFDAWEPYLGARYSPSWFDRAEVRDRGGIPIEEIIQRTKSEVRAGVEEFICLIEVPEYVSAMKVVLAYLQLPDEEKDEEEHVVALEEATATLDRIIEIARGESAGDGGCEIHLTDVVAPADVDEFKGLRDDPRKYKGGILCKCPGFTTLDIINALKHRLEAIEAEEAEESAAGD